MTDSLRICEASDRNIDQECKHGIESRQSQNMTLLDRWCKTILERMCP
jgi:hypothetical protein